MYNGGSRYNATIFLFYFTFFILTFWVIAPQPKFFFIFMVRDARRRKKMHSPAVHFLNFLNCLKINDFGDFFFNFQNNFKI